jgi:beta-lactamase class D
MRQTLLLLFALSFIISCRSSKESENAESSEPSRLALQEIQKSIDSLQLKGSVLVYDQNGNTFYSNDFDWSETGFLPASTFKIANSIQALENGIVQDDSTMFYWDKQPRRMAAWEKDMTFKEAFKASCVPCYQQIALETGVKRMRETLDKIGYPGMVFDSTTIDNFWLEGNSKITQFQQIDFLKRLVNKELAVSDKTYEVMSKIMFMEEKPGYDLYGKTGWAQPDDSTNVGWFVGYAITPKDTLYVATNIQPTAGFDMDHFIKVRIDLATKGLEAALSN